MTPFAATTTTVEVTDLPKIRKRFEKLAAKAGSLDVAAPVLEVSAPREIDVNGWAVEVADVTVVIPETVVIPGGWRLVAAIDVTEAGNVIRSFRPEVPASLHYVAGTRCDHCHRSIKRKFLVALESAVGELVVIGKTCSAEFIGLDLDALLAWYGFGWAIEPFTPDEEGFDGSGGGGKVWTARFVDAAAEAINYFGYSKASNWDTSTKSDALAAYRPSRHWMEAIEGLEMKGSISGAEALAWAKAIEPRNDFESNLRVVAHSSTLDPRWYGIAAFIPEGYRRHIEAEAVRIEKAKNEAPKVRVPDFDGRATIEGVVISTKTVENDFGISYKMLVEVAAEGGAFRLFGTEPRGLDVEAGDRVRFTARVERSDRDETFGFFSRPTKAVNLTAEALLADRIAKGMPEMACGHTADSLSRDESGPNGIAVYCSRCLCYVGAPTVEERAARARLLENA